MFSPRERPRNKAPLLIVPPGRTSWDHSVFPDVLLVVRAISAGSSCTERERVSGGSRAVLFFELFPRRSRPAGIVTLTFCRLVTKALRLPSLPTRSARAWLNLWRRSNPACRQMVAVDNHGHHQADDWLARRGEDGPGAGALTDLKHVFRRSQKPLSWREVISSYCS